MTALIVVESSFGNTRLVAEAVRDGVARHMPVELVDVGEAPPELPDGVDLLVVGAPTHELGMSTPASRAEAVNQGASPAAARIGVREWIAQLVQQSARPPFITFDTRTRAPWLAGSAAAQASALLSEHGFRCAAARMSFRVEATSGPLYYGEYIRAREWADAIGAKIETRERLRRR